jgi:hypothetical protein
MTHEHAQKEQKQQAEQMEKLLDLMGMDSFLETLSQIAYEKSEHVLTTWQDKPLAQSWSKVGLHVDKLKNRFAKLNLGL